MRKIDETDLLTYVQGTKESRKLEFKPGFDWDNITSRKLKEEVIKAIISLTNTPGGGIIVLGTVHQQKGKHF